MKIGWYGDDDLSLADFKALVAQTTTPKHVPHADQIVSNVPIYDMERLRPTLMEYDRWALMREWMWVLKDGPGVIALKNSFRDVDPINGAIDRASAVFDQIIRDEAEGGGGGGDHFAASGTNSRIWNALEKLCLADPEVFALYHGNPAIDAVCEAWLGRGYQMTAQVNVVRPGGAAQTAHRDYHLGFMDEATTKSYPAHMHHLCPLLTLQGAIAHCDMPIDSGPTKLLPYSQAYAPGYAAYHKPEFAAFFEDNYVQVPLEKGDVLFFNPATFHAAGENRTTDIHRMANLIQVSSPFGRAMEAVDRVSMCKRLYGTIQQDLFPRYGYLLNEFQAAIACAAEGYAFPSNLDTDPPRGGLAPESMADIFARCLQSGAQPEAFAQEMDDMVQRKAT